MAKLELSPKIRSVMPKVMLDHIKQTDKKTKRALVDEWIDNLKQNVKHHLPNHGLLNDGFEGFGKNRLAIGIGSGPSLNKNEEMLKNISLLDGTRDLNQQDIILMASNHQIKPCLEKGIIPHFAMLADASPDLKFQLDVGDIGKHTVLIAAITAHPDVIAVWPGPVRFVVQHGEELRKAFIKEIQKYKLLKDRHYWGFTEGHCVTEGGNILNLSFVLSIGLFKCSAWACVGNDLSYPPADDEQDQRDGYYADGDYTTNIQSRRDEARHKLAWAGFEYPQWLHLPNNEYINFVLRYTSPQLFVYKVWLESTACVFWEAGMNFKVYNCSEGGILGVILKEEAQDTFNYLAKFEDENWMLLDHLVPGRWRTRKLDQAVAEHHLASLIASGTLTMETARELIRLQKEGTIGCEEIMGIEHAALPVISSGLIS